MHRRSTQCLAGCWLAAEIASWMIRPPFFALFNSAGVKHVKEVR
jgi:hypothetical protein